MPFKKSQLQFISIILSSFLLLTQSIWANTYESNYFKNTSKSSQLAYNSLASSLPHHSSNYRGPAPGSSSLHIQTIQNQLNSSSKLNKINIPAQLGVIQNVQTQTNNPKKSLFFIQDIHGNLEAQTNIGELINWLESKYGVKNIYLEGIFSEVNLMPFTDPLYKKSVGTAAEYLFKKRELAGPIYSSLSHSAKDRTLMGIDDPNLYQKNVEAYRMAASIKNLAQEVLEKQKNDLISLKRKFYSPALIRLDQMTEDYAENKASLGSYAQYLLEQNTSLDFFPTLEIYHEALLLEKSIDQDLVEQERRKLIRELAQKLSTKEDQRFLLLSRQFMDGKIDHFEFYTQLKLFCEAVGISLSRLSEFSKYISYIRLTNEISGKEFFEEFKGLEDKVYQQMCSSTDEHRVIAMAKANRLTKKLFEFSLSPSEWDEYQEIKIALPSHDAKVLKTYEEFYRVAKDRDQAMVKNIQANLLKSSKNTGILVAGGFHTEGIVQGLMNEGYRVITIVPKVTTHENSNTAEALSLLTQTRSPLDEFLEGKKLFLPPMGWSILIQNKLGLFTAASSVWFGNSVSRSRSFFSKFKSSANKLVQIHLRGNEIEMVIENLRGRRVIVTVEFNELGIVRHALRYSPRISNWFDMFAPRWALAAIPSGRKNSFFANLANFSLSARSENATGSQQPLSKKIVVVDDNPGTKNIISLLLKKHGYQVAFFANPQEAVEYIRKNQADIVLSDYNMPIMTGLELRRALIEMNSYWKTHFVMMTGTRKEQIEDPDINDVQIVPKPFGIEKLISVLDKKIHGSPKPRLYGEGTQPLMIFLILGVSIVGLLGGLNYQSLGGENWAIWLIVLVGTLKYSQGQSPIKDPSDAEEIFNLIFSYQAFRENAMQDEQSATLTSLDIIERFQVGEENINLLLEKGYLKLVGPFAINLVLTEKGIKATEKLILKQSISKSSKIDLSLGFLIGEALRREKLSRIDVAFILGKESRKKRAAENEDQYNERKQSYLDFSEKEGFSVWFKYFLNHPEVKKYEFVTSASKIISTRPKIQISYFSLVMYSVKLIEDLGLSAMVEDGDKIASLDNYDEIEEFFNEKRSQQISITVLGPSGSSHIGERAVLVLEYLFLDSKAHLAKNINHYLTIVGSFKSEAASWVIDFKRVGKNLGWPILIILFFTLPLKGANLQAAFKDNLTYSSLWISLIFIAIIGIPFVVNLISSYKKGDTNIGPKFGLLVTGLMLVWFIFYHYLKKNRQSSRNDKIELSQQKGSETDSAKAIQIVDWADSVSHLSHRYIAEQIHNHISQAPFYLGVDSFGQVPNNSHFLYTGKFEDALGTEAKRKNRPSLDFNQAWSLMLAVASNGNENSVNELVLDGSATDKNVVIFVADNDPLESYLPLILRLRQAESITVITSVKQAQKLEMLITNLHLDLPINVKEEIAEFYDMEKVLFSKIHQRVLSDFDGSYGNFRLVLSHQLTLLDDLSEADRKIWKPTQVEFFNAVLRTIVSLSSEKVFTLQRLANELVVKSQA